LARIWRKRNYKIQLALKIADPEIKIRARAAAEFIAAARCGTMNYISKLEAAVRGVRTTREVKRKLSFFSPSPASQITKARAPAENDIFINFAWLEMKNFLSEKKRETISGPRVTIIRYRNFARIKNIRTSL
jgi:hypothetical protein